MALVLDTDTLPGHERTQAFHAAFEAASLPSHVSLRGAVSTRMRFTGVGAAAVFSADSTGFSLRRTERMCRRPGPEIVTLTLQRRGTARLEQDHTGQMPLRTGQLFLTDLTSPYYYDVPEAGDVLAFQLELPELGTSMERLRHAAPRLEQSPLYALVRHHLARLEPAAEEVEGTAAAPLLGGSTLLLFRALVDSVGGAAGRPALMDVLFERIDWYVQQHLSDPDLSAARIAAAHHISVRHLFALLAARGLTLRQWLLEQRLEGARDDLAGQSGRTIAAVARAWGFADPGHFARRFRERFDCTPSEWRQACVERASLQGEELLPGQRTPSGAS